MTNEEALLLKPGDYVYAASDGRVVLCEVEEIEDTGDGPPSPRNVYLWIRRIGKTRGDRKFSRVYVVPRYIHHAGPRDPLSAHVYADYLEERGEGRAAKILRDAFPLGEEKVTG